MSMSGSGGAASMNSAQLTITGVGSIKFPYNPQEWSFTKEAVWEHTPQTAAPQGGTPQFQGTKAQVMNINITLDRFGEVPIDPDSAITMLCAATEPTEDSTNKNSPEPPTVTLQWGQDMIVENGYIKRVKITKKDLNPTTGTLNIAEAELEIETIPAATPGQNPTSGALASRRSHIVIDGDTLASIAFAEYRNPNKWRALAIANGIDDPMRLRPGTVLMVPDPSEVKNLT